MSYAARLEVLRRSRPEGANGQLYAIAVDLLAQVENLETEAEELWDEAAEAIQTLRAAAMRAVDAEVEPGVCRHGNRFFCGYCLKETGEGSVPAPSPSREELLTEIERLKAEATHQSALWQTALGHAAEQDREICALRAENGRLLTEAKHIRTERVIPLACLLHDVAAAAGVSDIGDPAEVSAKIRETISALKNRQGRLAEATRGLLAALYKVRDWDSTRVGDAIEACETSLKELP